MFGKVFVGSEGGKGERELIWKERGDLKKEWSVFENDGKVRLVMVFGNKRYEVVGEGKIGVREV